MFFQGLTVTRSRRGAARLLAATLSWSMFGCGPGPHEGDAGIGDAAVDAPEWFDWRAESISNCDGPPTPVWLPRNEHAPGEFLWTRSWAEIRRDTDEPVLRPPYALTGRTPLLSGDGFVTFTWREREQDMRLLARDGTGSGGGAWWVSLMDYHPVGRMWLGNGHTYGIQNSLTALALTGADGVAPELVYPTLVAEGQVPFQVGGGWPRAALAWSPRNRAAVLFTFPGLVFSGCLDRPEPRWAHRVPLGRFGTTTEIYVRANGDAIVAGDTTMVISETGELLRTTDFFDRDYPPRPAGFHDACGVLFMTQPEREWRWLDVETMEFGPPLGGVPSASGEWSGTADCGLVYRSSLQFLRRLAADGTSMHETLLPSGIAGHPIPLADGSTFVPLADTGWFVVAADGTVTQSVDLGEEWSSRRVVGDGALAPDGTYFFAVSDILGDSYAFAAVATGLRPGPLLWTGSGLNFAHTNSALP
jgi:hypothetical protein